MLSLLTGILMIVVGLVTVFNGRSLYWVIVGVAGFLVGELLHTWLFAERYPLLFFLLAIGVGLLGIWAARRFETVSLLVAGFVLGGFVMVVLFVDGGTVQPSTTLETILFLLGGLLGVLSVHWSQNRSFIVLTSLGGAGLVIRALALSPAPEATVFCALAALGMLLQARDWLLPAATLVPQEVASARSFFEE